MVTSIGWTRSPFPLSQTIFKGQWKVHVTTANMIHYKYWSFKSSWQHVKVFNSYHITQTSIMSERVNSIFCVLMYISSNFDFSDVFFNWLLALHYMGGEMSTVELKLVIMQAFKLGISWSKKQLQFSRPIIHFISLIKWREKKFLSPI